MSRLEKLKQNRSEQQPLVYSRTEKETEHHFRGPVTIVILALLMCGLVYLLFFSGLFNIQKIEVNGYGDPAKVQQIATEQVGGGLLAGNILLFDKSSLTDTLKGDPLISAVNIQRILPNKIIISITESKPSLIWDTAGDKYLMDERGDIIGPLMGGYSKLPIVYDSAGIKVSRGEMVASPIFVNFIQKIWAGFGGATGVQISKITIFDLLSDIHVLSSAGWTVYFNASNDAGTQLTNLTKILKVVPAGTKLEYIDLRLANRAYYK